MWHRSLVLALLLVVVGGLLVRPGPVAAHALLVRSEPSHDARLRAPPERVAAWFSEPLEPGISTLRVVTGSGERVDTGEVEVDRSDRTTMAVALRKGVGSGFYTVTWETLSRIDGHIRFGSFEFTVVNPDGSPPTGPRAAAEITGADAPGVVEGTVVKIAGLLGAVLLVGSVAFALLVGRPATEVLDEPAAEEARAASERWLVRVVAPTVILLALAGAAELMLQARQLGGFDTIGSALATTWGKRWLLRQAALLGVAAAVALYLWLRRSGPRGATFCLWAALAGGLGYLLLVSAVSHGAAVTRGSFWATLADFVHFGAAAVWVGGLVQLGLLLWWSRQALPVSARPGLLASALRRFSLLAATSMVLLLATGVFNALVQTGSLRALVETEYGRALTGKLALSLPLLAVAGVNALILRPRAVRAALAARESERLVRLLRRLVIVEASLALAVLAAAGVLVQFPTARPVAEAAADFDPYAYPLVAGNWAAVGGGALVVAGGLLWIWAGRRSGPRRELRGVLRTAAAGLSVVGVMLVLVALNPRAPDDAEPVAVERPSPAPGGTPAAAAQPRAEETVFTPTVALRFQAGGNRFVLLEIAPFRVGENTVRVTVLDDRGQAVDAGAATLRVSRLERAGDVSEVAATPASEGRRLLADVLLSETGWWAIDVGLGEGQTASFYLRLDEPSQAPLAFAPPDYASEPAAERLFERAVARYEHLASLRWREQLTSGLLAPTGIGAWVVSDGEAEALDRIHLHVLSPGFSEYDLYRVGGRSCTRDRGGPWRCTRVEGEPAFDLEYQDAATAFRLGREESVDGVPTRVLLFYNAVQPAWYAWWIDERTGDLHRQAMVAAGHFMLTRYFDHNVPMQIAFPPSAPQ